MAAAAELAPVLDAGASQSAVAALDIGVSKTVCLIGKRDAVLELHPQRPVRIVGVGVQSAPGVASGQAADFDACARAIRVAVDQAERMAGEEVFSVTASYAGPGLTARTLRGAARVRGPIVAQRDLDAALAAAIHSSPHPGRAVLQTSPLRYWIDEAPEPVADPKGANARVIEVEACVVSAPLDAIEALCACIRQAGLDVDNIVPAPFSSALGALSREERAQGVLVLDLGAGSTGMAAFSAAGLVHAETIPIGGVRMTRDLAKRLDTTFAAAERAKLVYGGIGAIDDPRRAVEAPRLGPDGRLEPAMALKGAIAESLQPRFHQILLAVRERLAAAELTGADGPRRLVLIGGGAMMPGARELASDILGMPARIGQPFELAGMEPGEVGPAYASAAGLLRWRLDHTGHSGAGERGDPTLTEAAATMRRVARRALGWLKENF